MPTNTLTDKFKKIDLPLKNEEVEWRAGNANMGGSKIYIKPMVYITARAVATRLDDAFGKDGWYDEYEETPKGVKCTLFINCGSTATKDKWIGKQDIGTPSSYESEKGAYSDALKRAFVKWSAATRELYTLGEVLAYGGTGTNYPNKNAINCYQKASNRNSELKYWFIAPVLSEVRDGTHDHTKPPKTTNKLMLKAQKLIENVYNAGNCDESYHDSILLKIENIGEQFSQKSLEFITGTIHSMLKVRADKKVESLLEKNIPIKKIELSPTELPTEENGQVIQEYSMDDVNEKVTHEQDHDLIDDIEDIPDVEPPVIEEPVIEKSTDIMAF